MAHRPFDGFAALKSGMLQVNANGQVEWTVG